MISLPLSDNLTATLVSDRVAEIRRFSGVPSSSGDRRSAASTKPGGTRRRRCLDSARTRLGFALVETGLHLVARYSSA
jgi:hypothetical protein